MQLECPVGSLSCWGRVKSSGQNLDPLGPGSKLVLNNVVYQEAGRGEQMLCGAFLESGKMGVAFDSSERSW